MGNGQTVEGGKKGLSNLAWIGIGCGAVLLMVILALGIGGWWLARKARDTMADFEANPGLAAARLIVKANPELEEVAVDEEKGTITVRETKTGKEFTVNFEDIRDGKISFSSGGEEMTIQTTEGEDGARVNITSDKGSLSFSSGEGAKEGDHPEWVPLYPGAERTGQYLQTREDGVSGALQLSTADSFDTVSSFYREQLSAAGFEVGVNTFSGEGQQAAMLSANDEAGGRTVVVTLGVEEGKTTIALTYNQTRQ